MKKLIGIVLLGYFSNIAAKELQELSEILKPLFACEEAIIKENSFLSNYKSELWPLISDDCAQQLKAAEIACGMQPNQNANACSDIINDKLDQHYQIISNKKIQED